MRKEIEKILKKCADGVVRNNVNQACIWWTYQPKLPKQVQRKFLKK